MQAAGFAAPIDSTVFAREIIRQLDPDVDCQDAIHLQTLQVFAYINTKGEAVAYGSPSGGKIETIIKTIKGLSDFSGRSRRTEVIYYWFATALVGGLISVTVGALRFGLGFVFVDHALRLLLVVPILALFVRRLHDQNRSGWWALLLPLSLVLSIPKVLAELRGDIDQIIVQNTSPANIAAAICGIAVTILFLLPGSCGENRYGPDPRVEAS